MKKYGKTIIITTVITLLPMVIGFLLWNRLPDELATHFGMNGEPNDWTQKPFAVVGLPVFLAVIQLIMAAATLNDPKRSNIHPKLMYLILWIIPVLSLISNISIYLFSMGIDIDNSIIACFLIGIVFILLGNYMPKLQQNYTVGIKLPWTLNSQENWTRTHRLSGKLWIAGGVVMIIGGFLSFWVILAVLLVCVAVPVGYSFWLYHKGY